MDEEKDGIIKRKAQAAAAWLSYVVTHVDVLALILKRESKQSTNLPCTVYLTKLPAFRCSSRSCTSAAAIKKDQFRPFHELLRRLKQLAVQMRNLWQIIRFAFFRRQHRAWPACCWLLQDLI
jgi:hypothetical protein